MVDAGTMGSPAAPSARTPRLLRDRSVVQRVTNIELFFDLVYVFAVTQLSHHLLGDPTVRGALQTGLLLVMVWVVWSYTTWVTNWLDRERMEVRLLLIVLMLVSLAMSAALPRAFGDLGLVVGGAYAIRQIGRTVFMVIALRGHPLQANFERILAWCVPECRCGAEVIDRSSDPGRLGRSAYHFIHPVMVAGIIVSAAADQKILSGPAATASTASAWMILGGPALFLAGHAAFKLVVWRFVSWPRLAGIAVLALLALAAPAIPELALAACAAGVVAAVAASDRLPWLTHPAA